MGGMPLADTVTDLARMSMAFGRIDRTACYHEDQQTRESDTDHTFMLGVVAMAIAGELYGDRLDLGLIAQLALVHDLPEVYAGDTPTLRIDAAGRAAKAEREQRALSRIEDEFFNRATIIPILISTYEDGAAPEAKFVRLVDKLLPKLVHQIDRCHGLIEEGITAEELNRILINQWLDLARGYGEGFPEVLALLAECNRRAVSLLATREREQLAAVSE